jgi:hypothetical protein
MHDKIIQEAAENYCRETYVRPTDEKGLKPYDETNSMPGYKNYSKRASKHFIAGVEWYRSHQFADAVTPPKTGWSRLWSKVKRKFKF